jgi:hypothetical protein
MTVDRNDTGFDQVIRFAPGADPTVGDELVQARQSVILGFGLRAGGFPERLVTASAEIRTATIRERTPTAFESA